MEETSMSLHLGEKKTSYNSDFAPENVVLSAENRCFWHDIVNNSDSYIGPPPFGILFLHRMASPRGEPGVRLHHSTKGSTNEKR